VPATYPSRTSRLFFWLLSAGAGVAGCRQDDDIVATLTEPDAGLIEDVTVTPPIDASAEADGPPITIDREVPSPDVVADFATSDPILPPPIDAPSIDTSPPTGCDGIGPILSVLRVSGARGQACGGQLAAHTFTHAVCACEDLGLAAIFSTGSFDSAAADKSTVQAGGGVGVVGSYPPVSSNIGGTLTVFGTARSPVIPQGLEAWGDLWLAGGATFVSSLKVHRDARFVSAVGYVGSVNIGRNLILGSAGSLRGWVGPEYIGGARIPSSFTVPEPCGCTDRLDIPAMEATGAATYDNAAIGLEVSALSNVTTLFKKDLPCGRYRFDSIGGPGPIQLTITGRVAIFVDNNATLPDSFQLTIAPGVDAEVDWLIRGNLSNGSARIGDTARPSATRIYVGGADNEIMVTGGLMAANIYAPNTNISLAGIVTGSFYGKNVNVIGASFASVTYDRSILNKGNKCDQPTPCDSTHFCNGSLACKQDVCQPCSADDDCALPLVCDATSNTCQPMLTFR
jgi:hypothetical protein